MRGHISRHSSRNGDSNTMSDYHFTSPLHVSATSSVYPTTHILFALVRSNSPQFSKLGKRHELLTSTISKVHLHTWPPRLGHPITHLAYSGQLRRVPFASSQAPPQNLRRWMRARHDHLWLPLLRAPGLRDGNRHLRKRHYASENSCL